MPRGRPRGSTARQSHPQQRLSFGPNATNKITKPSPLASDAKKSSKLSPKQKSQLESAASVSGTSTPEKSPSPPAEIVTKPEAEIEKSGLPIRGSQKPAGRDSATQNKTSERDAREVEAGKVSEAQIRKYWVRKEEERRVPRVHQEGLGVHEKVLREWDMSNQYGPCIGITRMKRWKRADKMGMKPPLEVLAVLVKEEGSQKGKGKEELQRAYIDTLIGGKSVEVEA